MRIIVGGQYYSTPDGASIQYSHSMSDPVPTAQINIIDNTSAISIQPPQEVLIIDDQQIANPTQNMLLNPSLNPYTTNWTATSFTGITLSQNGGGGLIATISNAPVGTSTILTQKSTVIPWYPVAGQAYMFSVYVQGSSSPSQFQAGINITWFDFAGNSLSAQGFTSAPLSTSLTRYSVSSTAPANVGSVRVELNIQTAFGASSGVVTFTQPQFEPVWMPNISYPTPWCGPSQTNCRQLPLGYYIRQYRKFAGFVTKVSPQDYHGNVRKLQLNCVGYAWLCDTIIGNDTFASKTDAQIITTLLGKYLLSNGVAMCTTSNVITGVSISSLQLNWDTLRTVFDGLAALSTFYWSIDEYWNFIYAPAGYISMPIQLICDITSTPDFVTTYPAYEFTAELDFTQPGSNILVLGNTTNTAQVIDASRVAQIGILTGYQLPSTTSWMRKINDSTLGAVADCTQRGMAELLQYDLTRGLYHLKTQVELLAGQGIRVTSNTDGLYQTMLLIQQVSAQWLGTSETLTDVWEYQADLGAVNRVATNMISRLFRRTNANTAATAISSTTLALLENLSLTDTIDSNSLYARTVLGDAVSRYYRFGEPAGFSGVVAYDWGGNAFNGTYTGANAFTLGQTGAIYNDTNTAVLLNGATGYISLPTNVIALNSSISVEAWIKLSSTSFGAAVRVLSYGDPAANNTGVELVINANGAGASYRVGNGTTNAQGTTTTQFVAGTWYHLVGVYNNATVQIYVNAVAQTANNLTGTVGNPSITNPLWGRYSISSSGFFPGTLDECAIYNGTALASGRIQAHYNIGTLGHS